MSIIRPVIRMSAVAAIKNRTYAEERVYDSDNTPLVDAVLNGPAKPYVVVFTDADTRMQIDGRDVYSTQRQLNLIIEMGVASAVELEKKGTILRFPQTDPMLELLMDVMETQIINAILTDPDSPFAEIIRQLVQSVRRMPSIRGGSGQRGTRWAARQLMLQVDTVADPAPGVAYYEGHAVRQFIELAKSSDFTNYGLANAAALLDVFLTPQADAAPDWKQAQAWLGLSKVGIEGTGIVPLPFGDVTAAELEQANVLYDDDLVLDPPAGDQQLRRDTEA